MARDSDQTKRRLFEAATAEFTAHGIAGARIDRIARSAGANKQLIYAYFGNKRQLFEAVVSENVTRFLAEVPFDVSDLPGYAGAMFSFYAANPEIAQLGSWHALEPGESEHRIAAIEDVIRKRTRAVARAQKDGLVEASVDAGDLLALISSIASTWTVATPERDPRGGRGPRAAARRRAAVEEAVRRLVSPAG